MIPSSTSRSSEKLRLEVFRSSEGRLEGQVRAESIHPWTSFSGVLELLKVIEEILDATENATNDRLQP
jgi:hypothetical protein